MVEPGIYKALHDNDVHPEMIFLKWLRVVYAREFDLNSLLYVWDYLFSSIPEDARL